MFLTVPFCKSSNYAPLNFRDKSLQVSTRPRPLIRYQVPITSQSIKTTVLQIILKKMPTIERVLEGCALGEGPHWDVASQSLYLVDIHGKKIFKYNPATKKITKASLEKAASFIIPIEGKKNEFIGTQDNELVVISWDGESEKASIIQKLSSVVLKFNDGKCDSSGRLWTGDFKVDLDDLTKTEPLGTVYSFSSKKQLTKHVDKIRCSNGLAFNEKNKKMFYIDSLAGSVDQFDFDVEIGSISNRQVWFTLSKFDISGISDGMTIDSDGNLWVAVFGESCVLKIDGNKEETLLDTIKLPATQVTSVAFGGANLDELYVTTGCLQFGEMKPQAPVDGAVYKVTGLGVRGLPADNFKLD